MFPIMFSIIGRGDVETCSLKFIGYWVKYYGIADKVVNILHSIRATRFLNDFWSLNYLFNFNISFYLFLFNFDYWIV